MPPLSTILLPRLRGFQLHRFLPMFSEDLSMLIEEGSPHIVLGGNGLGKTTIMQAVVYALTGGASEQIETEKTFRWDHRYFRGRLNADDLREATVTVDFSLGRATFSVVRGFMNNSILDLKQGGKRRPVEQFAQALNHFGGYASVEDFAFVVHRLLYLPESRRLIAWDTDAQVRLLMLLNQDASSEEKFREHRKNLKLMDSKKRHTHVAIGKADEQLASLMEYQEDDDTTEVADVEDDEATAPVDVTALAQQLQEIFRLRMELERDLKDQERSLSETSSAVEELRQRIDNAETLIINSVLSEEERNSSLALNRLVENGICPACGTKQLELQELARRHARSAQCVLCGSESPQQELELLSTLRSQMAEKLHAQRAAEGLVRTARTKLDEVQSREWDIRTVYNTAIAAEPVVSLMERNLPSRSRTDLLALKTKLQREEADLEVKIQQLQERLQQEYQRFRTAISERTNILRVSYASYATSFLGLDCKLSDLATGDRLLSLSGFVPEFDGHRRDIAESCSEAQRFFLDIAFRMALIDSATELSGYPATFLCETPETALDISYIDNVVKMFTSFTRKRQSVLLTANIQPNGIAGKLLHSLPKGKRSERVLNLLKFGHLSNVQTAAKKMLERIVKQTIGSGE
jgi:predicted RNA-binding Zn-ribbon protein involved in translation (DUF1610 family)